jgi:hypothetical protein
MRRILLVLTAALATAAVAVPAALADSPHYIKGPTVSVSDNSLSVTWKAVGLGNTVNSVEFTLTGTANVSSQCYTKTGNPVNGVPKQETVDIDTSGNFPVRNGSVTGNITVSPLSTLTCTGNQHVVATLISYDLFLNGDNLPEQHLQG